MMFIPYDFAYDVSTFVYISHMTNIEQCKHTIIDKISFLTTQAS